MATSKDRGGEYKNVSLEEQDAVELRKAVATGSVKEPFISSASLSIACYCIASILMTVVNKFVVSGRNFSMNFLLLCIQSTVCVLCVLTVKKTGIISFRNFDLADAKMWFPISFSLVTVIYSGSKSLQYLTIPVYTIFKNLTIILIAYGEVLWFGGRVTALTLVSFIFMVISSIIAAWSDISQASTSVQGGISSVTSAVSALNVGYLWMFANCITSATYVLAMRKKIKVTGFSDWDSMFLQQPIVHPSLTRIFLRYRRLGLR